MLTFCFVFPRGAGHAGGAGAPRGRGVQRNHPGAGGSRFAWAGAQLQGSICLWWFVSDVSPSLAFDLPLTCADANSSWSLSRLPRRASCAVLLRASLFLSALVPLHTLRFPRHAGLMSARWR